MLSFKEYLLIENAHFLEEMAAIGKYGLDTTSRSFPKDFASLIEIINTAYPKDTGYSIRRGRDHSVVSFVHPITREYERITPVANTAHGPLGGGNFHATLQAIHRHQLSLLNDKAPIPVFLGDQHHIDSLRDAIEDLNRVGKMEVHVPLGREIRRMVVPSLLNPPEDLEAPVRRVWKRRTYFSGENIPPFTTPRPTEGGSRIPRRLLDIEDI